MEKIADNNRENKMGVMPVSKLLLNMSLPMMISMMVQALYNVVDSIFVARINENALTAVSLTFPIQNLMISIIAGTCVGVNALLSRSLGEQNQEKANKTASTAIFLAFVCYIIVLAIGIFGVEPFFRSQTSDAQIVEYGITYSRIVCCLSIGAFMQITLERLLQSTGRTFLTMISQSTGAIINIIMDPILIFGLFGIPAMGIAGAAAATVFGQIVACIMAVYFNMKHNPDIQISFRGFRPELKIIKAIYSVGLPSILMMSIGSVMNYGINKILLAFTSTAAAVFGVYFKLQSFIFMPVFGLNGGMVPIIAFNYGARNRKRVIDTIKLSIGYAVGIMLVGVFIFMVFPNPLLALFNASEDMIKMGASALRIISICFPFAGFSIVCGSVFQAMGNGIYTLVNSIMRQLVVLLPAAWMLSKLGDVVYVWWAFPIAEVVSVTLMAIFMMRMYRNVISKI